ncbi:transcription factor TFIID complex subunit Taf13 [Schizosaccharomyces osmophilus]|uniref:Transcription initiation factor TFIID subunit 13 n=2 Tax=Schizosaccharomyces TaxID=4895 RepID=S9PRC7_SCHOY|nr:transcription factor TFIID complex subunit Taf13 [Schizosaccharomyces octosporus yFS286]XP_056039840.1 transcription factor TFIID complex subunit Taf13 [Schizosaccharomyces osmophilus]EPX71731.1 transcription factor TFIID complex subunit Taf13 [Schizosaccharomyces octosporus yFS286]WBW75597.1 transcription factor TFIID complex subunit Taf13 [Schizosaccharomyces osmophilus]
MSMESRRGRPPTRRQHLFTKDLKSLMYAFGDDLNPAPDSVNVLEEIVVDYINEMCLEAARIAGNRNKVKVDDFKFALRNDPKKLGRVEELLVLQKMIADTRNVMKYNKDHF